jgi:S1-C subfamily serine protease
MLLTCSRLTAGAKSIQVQALDGVAYPATLVAADETTGIALIKVADGHFSPMALGQTTPSGAVQIAAFTKPAIFAPSMEMLAGELSSTDQATFTVRTAIHPRSAGSPLLDAQGNVVGMLTATRDDPVGRLPVVMAEAMRKFSTGKFTSAAHTTANSPVPCVLELSAVHEN